VKIIDHENKVINLTNSSRNTFDTCRKKFYFGNMLDDHGIRLAGPHSAALLIGDVVHEMFAAALTNQIDDDIVLAGRQAVKRAEDSIEYPTAKLEANIEKARCLIPGLVEVAHEVRKRIAMHGEVAAVEEHMSIELGEVRGYRVILHGKLDVLMASESEIDVIDHKTVSAFRSTFHDRCMFDPQLTTYAMLAHENWLKCHVSKVGYMVFRKPQIRQKKSETDKQFADRLTEFLMETHPDDYLQFVSTSRVNAEMQETCSMYLQMANDLLECDARDFWRPCTNSCDLYAGCPYLMICAGSDDGSINYVSKKSTHEELQTEGDEDW